jgi:hypothetical protein
MAIDQASSTAKQLVSCYLTKTCNGTRKDRKRPRQHSRSALGPVGLLGPPLGPRPARGRRGAPQCSYVRDVVSEEGRELLTQAKHPGALQRFDLQLWVPPRSCVDAEMHPDAPKSALGGINGASRATAGEVGLRPGARSSSYPRRRCRQRRLRPDRIERECRDHRAGACGAESNVRVDRPLVTVTWPRVHRVGRDRTHGTLDAEGTDWAISQSGSGSVHDRASA